MSFRPEHTEDISKVCLLNQNYLSLFLTYLRKKYQQGCDLYHVYLYNCLCVYIFLFY